MALSFVGGRGAAPASDEMRGQRYVGLDRLRGLAVVLMVVDHLLLVSGAPAITRVGPTRLALPLFALVAGSLPRSWFRLGQVAVAGLVMSMIGSELGTGSPDVLLVIAGGLGLLALVQRQGESAVLVLAVLAVLQPVTWPLGGSGYELGTVLALCIVGWCWGRTSLARVGERLPLFLDQPGRVALHIYVAHLTVLWLVFG